MSMLATALARVADHIDHVANLVGPGTTIDEVQGPRRCADRMHDSLVDQLGDILCLELPRQEP